MAESQPAHRRRAIIRFLQIVLSVGLVAGIFVRLIPSIAGYSAVWSTIAHFAWLELAALIGATVVSVVLYWPQIVASMPGLTLAQAAVTNQTTSTIANVLPGGGAVAVGVGYGMYRAWGFTRAEIARSALVTGVWNVFLKLGLPLVAMVALAAYGRTDGGTIVGTIAGGTCLCVGGTAMWLLLRRTRSAHALGQGLGTLVSFGRRLVRKPPVASWGAAAVRFRSDMLALLRQRWKALTITTLASHLGLYLVLLLALRFAGVSEREIGWEQVLGVFAFVRLISTIPVTPGGVGVVELGYIGGLVLAGQGHAIGDPAVFRAQVAAAVLVFRAFTWGLQIPFGALTYVVWQRKHSWRVAPA